MEVNADYASQLYIIEGVITIFVGLLIVFVLPDFPQNWSLLSPEMKHVAVRRMAIDAAEADIDEPGGMSQLQGVKLAFTDPKTYILAIGYHGKPLLPLPSPDIPLLRVRETL